jgi:hypothetical protein
MSSTIKIECTVQPGRGLSSRDQAVTDTVSRLCGFAAFPGSLNLVAKQPVRLGSKPPSLRDPTITKSVFVPATLLGSPVIIRRWGICPLHIFQVHAAIRLRTAFELEDGDRVILHIPSTCVAQIGLKDWFFWSLLWKRRENLYYRSDQYLSLIRKHLKGKYRGTQRIIPKRPSL